MSYTGCQNLISLILLVMSSPFESFIKTEIDLGRTEFVRLSVLFFGTLFLLRFFFLES